MFFTGSDAVINAASFYAAAGNISDSDFLAGTDRFTTSGGVLTNAGTINAPNGVALIGSKVINSGTIVSGQGVVALCAGDEVYLAENGSGVKVRVDNLDAATGQGGTSSSASTEVGVLNEGTVSGDEVLFSCGDVYSLAVVNRGKATASGGAVTMSGNGLVQNEGQIDVSDSSAGAVGGTVKMLGETVVMDDGSEALFQIDGPFVGQVSDEGLVQDLQYRFTSVLNLVKKTAESSYTALSQIEASAKPDEFEFSFGVKLTGEAGIAFAKAGAEGTFQVKLTWKTESTTTG